MTRRRAAACARGGCRVPSYAFPEDAARALAAVRVPRAGGAARPATVPELDDADRPDAAAAVIARALRPRARDWLTPPDAAALLACYGIPLVPARRAAHDARGGGGSPRELGGRGRPQGGRPRPGPQDRGAVPCAWTSTAAAVEAGAAEAMAASVAARRPRADRFLVQRMAATGIELLVGVVHDPTFGPLVACGAGGVTAELLARRRRAPDPADGPATRARWCASLRDLPAAGRLPRRAARRRRPRSRTSLVRVAALADAHPEIAELDLNPVIVAGGGAVVVDARIRVAPPRPVVPWPALPRAGLVMRTASPSP